MLPAKSHVRPAFATDDLTTLLATSVPAKCPTLRTRLQPKSEVMSDQARLATSTSAKAGRTLSLKATEPSKYRHRSTAVTKIAFHEGLPLCTTLPHLWYFAEAYTPAVHRWKVCAKVLGTPFLTINAILLLKSPHPLFEVRAPKAMDGNLCT